MNIIKKFICLILGIVTICYSQSNNNTSTQKRIDIINKEIAKKGYKWKASISALSNLTTDQKRKLCGEFYDTNKVIEDLKYQQKMYNEYLGKSSNTNKKILTIPDWKNYTSRVENQTHNNCWAFAVTGVTTTALQKLIGNVPGTEGINLSEDILSTNNGCGSGYNGGNPNCGFSYVRNSKLQSQQGINVSPNFDKAFYGIDNFTCQENISIDFIKTALLTSPVYVSMYVYDDFYDYYSSDPNSVYRHVWGANEGSHAVVILGYDDAQQCWICKNSWGTGWGINIGAHFNEEDGYFKIGYGECGIDSRRAAYVTVSEKNLAKVCPEVQLFENAMSHYYDIFTASGEESYVTQNITIPQSSNQNGICIPACAKININNKTLYSNRVIAVESGATITGYSAIFKDATNSVRGYCPDIATAISLAPSGMGIELLPQTYNQSITVSNRAAISITGQGNSTVITGSISGTNCPNLSISNLYLSDETNGKIILNNTPASIESVTFSALTEYLKAYNSSTVVMNNCTANTINSASDIDGVFYSSDASIGGNNLSNHLCSIFLSGSTTAWISGNNFCSNEQDVYANSSVPARIQYNSHSRNNPEQTNCVSGNYIFYWRGAYCGSSATLAKSKAGSANTQSALDPIQEEIAKVDSLNFLQNNSNNKGGGAKLYSTNEVTATDILELYKTLFSNYSNTKYSTAILDRIIRKYSQNESYSGIKTFIDNVINGKSNKAAKDRAKKHLINYYVKTKNIPMALNTADEIINSKNIEEDTKCEALYEKGLIYKYDEGNEQLANIQFTKVLNNYPSNILAKFAAGEMKIKFASDKKQAPTAQNTEEAVKEYSCASYPNPFNPETVISYKLPTDGNVRLVVYNMLGQQIKTLVNEFKSAGSHQVRFNANDLPSGVYVYRIDACKFTKTAKMLLMK